MMLLLLALAMPVPAAVSPALPPRVRELMADAEYGLARRELDILLRQNPPADRRVVMHVAHAVCDVSLGDTVSAQQSFQKVLTLDPGHRPDANRTSPKVLEVFELVRARMAEEGALDQAYGPRFEPLEDVAAGTPVPVKITFEAAAASAVRTAYMRYRRVGEASFESVELARVPGDTVAFQGVLPAEALVPADDELALDYVVDGLAADGARLSGAGTVALPLKFRVVKPAVLAAAAVPTRRRKDDGMKRALEVAAVVMPVVFGVVTVGGVGLLAFTVLGLTALEPGASHFFLRPRPQDGGP